MNFVQNEFDGDYEKGGDEYSKIKNRDRDNIFNLPYWFGFYAIHFLCESEEFFVF